MFPITVTSSEILGRKPTVAFLNEIVEGVPVASVSELVVVRWKFLQTLHCNCTKVARKSCVLSQHCRAPGYKAVDKRLSSHLWTLAPPSRRLANNPAAPRCAPVRLDLKPQTAANNCTTIPCSNKSPQ